MRLDYRWTATNATETRQHAAELAALAPDVILATGNSTVVALLQVTRTVPIVFTVAGDPVGAGFVESLARPGGNVTGFMNFEYSVSGKWLELLKEIAPNVTRVAVPRDAAYPPGSASLPAPGRRASFRVEVVPVNIREAGEIEGGVSGFAQTPNGGRF